MPIPCSAGDPTPAAPLTPGDWSRLAALRRVFLDADARGGGTSLPDYWTNRRDLELYDATFGARIGWKWDAVLDEIERAGIEVPDGVVVDWGAGTGVAARRFVARHRRGRAQVHLHERSPAARAFATERLRAEYETERLRAEHESERLRAEHASERMGAKPAATGSRALEFVDALPDEPAVLLASHVASETSDAEHAAFLALARRAHFLVWIEPGSKAIARLVSTARDALLDALDPLLPCTHRAACGVLAAGREGDWCHHFATPAPEAFTTAHWRAFSRELGVDLRSLPYAYLVARRRSQAPLPLEGATRVLGTPRVEKGKADLLVCDAHGVAERTLLARVDRAYTRDLERGRAERVLDLEITGERITSLRARRTSPAAPSAGPDGPSAAAPD